MLDLAPLLEAASNVTPLLELDPLLDSLEEVDVRAEGQGMCAHLRAEVPISEQSNPLGPPMMVNPAGEHGGE